MMPEKEYMTIKDELGNEKVYEVDAMFEMNGNTYVMITADDETLIMKVVEKRPASSRFNIR